jgi:hypothetical protein
MLDRSDVATRLPAQDLNRNLLGIGQPVRGGASG